MRNTQVHILFSGGVTGGHLFPGLAVAEQLKCLHPGVRITFAGAGRALDRQQVFKAGHEYLGVPCHATPRRLTEIKRFLSNNRKGVHRAIEFIENNNVSLVVGLGGFASVPAARAARRCQVPLVLFEQNVYPGRATRWLARSATMVLAAFAETKKHLRTRGTFRAIGNPVRSRFLRAVQPHDSVGKKQLLILGGSNGAGELNREVPKALYRCRDELSDWNVTHQSGSSQHDETKLLYSKLGLPVQVSPFMEDMAAAIGRADLVISRAGGTILSELAVAQVPTILCPLAKATDDHQRRNAEYYGSRKAAVVMPALARDTRFDIALADILTSLLVDEPQRQVLSAAIGRLARADAASRAADLIMQTICPAHGIPAPLSPSVGSLTQSRL